MKLSHTYIFFLVLVVCVPPFCLFGVAAGADANHDYMDIPRLHKDSLKNSGQINDRLFQPAMSDRDFETFDGSTSFSATLTCASEAPVVKVSAFPVGSLATIGELNVRVEYDADLAGALKGSLTVNNVAGMCGNGYVKNCNPSGSWQNCQYCLWEWDNGVLKEKCDYGSGDSKAPIGPAGLKGCFCFNGSCGAPVMSMMETILSFAANGVLQLMREANPLLAVTNSE